MKKCVLKFTVPLFDPFRRPEYNFSGNPNFAGFFHSFDHFLKFDHSIIKTSRCDEMNYLNFMKKLLWLNSTHSPRIPSHYNSFFERDWQLTRSHFHHFNVKINIPQEVECMHNVSFKIFTVPEPRQQANCSQGTRSRYCAYNKRRVRERARANFPFLPASERERERRRHSGNKINIVNSLLFRLAL